MTVQHLPSQLDYCATDCYQSWLAGFKPPAEWPVDVWMDSEQSQWQWTPRRHAQTRWATRLPFHLIDSILPIPSQSVDIGCGEHLFGTAYPGVTGVDLRFASDDWLDSAWWHQNRDRWGWAWSICALHFVADWAGLAHNIAQLVSVLRPGGRAFVAINRECVARPGTAEVLAGWPSVDRVIWLDQPHNAPMDGNVWIWISKNKE
jgi:hypothetical protein